MQQLPIAQQSNEMIIPYLPTSQVIAEIIIRTA